MSLELSVSPLYPISRSRLDATTFEPQLDISKLQKGFPVAVVDDINSYSATGYSLWAFVNLAQKSRQCQSQRFPIQDKHCDLKGYLHITTGCGCGCGCGLGHKYRFLRCNVIKYA